MEFLIFLLIIAVVIIGAPITVSFLLYRWIKKKQFSKKWRLISFVPILILGFFIYQAIYPDSDFYKEDFEQVVEMPFPTSGEIRYEIASYPDHFGDYTSSFLIELDKEDMDRLESHILNVGFKEVDNTMSSEELDYVESKVDSKEYLKQYARNIDADKYFSVGFLNDGKSVIITRTSW